MHKLNLSPISMLLLVQNYLKISRSSYRGQHIVQQPLPSLFPYLLTLLCYQVDSVAFDPANRF